MYRLDCSYLIKVYLASTGTIVLLIDDPKELGKYHKTLTNCFEDVATEAKKMLLAASKIKPDSNITWIHDDRIKNGDIFLVEMEESNSKYSSPVWDRLE